MIAGFTAKPWAACPPTLRRSRAGPDPLSQVPPASAKNAADTRRQRQRHEVVLERLRQGHALEPCEPVRGRHDQDELVGVAHDALQAVGQRVLADDRGFGGARGPRAPIEISRRLNTANCDAVVPDAGEFL